jgi:hypothetical protein
MLLKVREMTENLSSFTFYFPTGLLLAPYPMNSFFLSIFKSVRSIALAKARI